MGGVDEVGRDVDARHPAAEFPRQPAGRAADPAADVQDMGFGCDLRDAVDLGRLIPGRGDTARMQMFDRRQVIRVQIVRIETGRAGRRVDGLDQVRPGPLSVEAGHLYSSMPSMMIRSRPAPSMSGTAFWYSSER